MPELARTIVSRLRAFVGNRRRARRCAGKLPFKVTLANRRLSAKGNGRVAWLEGTTRDVSVSGAGLIVPAIRIGEHYLVGDDRVLSIAMELPTGPVEIKAVPVRYEGLEEFGEENGYLIGVRISEMTPQHRSQYQEFIHRLIHQAPLD